MVAAEPLVLIPISPKRMGRNTRWWRSQRHGLPLLLRSGKVLTRKGMLVRQDPVSYTHLTLPTILLV
eukprot:5401228-Pyramimonas_sp.AAC.1